MNVKARIANLDGNDIQMASSSGNSAILKTSTGELTLHFVDVKRKITLDIAAAPITATGTVSLNGLSENAAHIVIGSNPSGQQQFCTCTDLTGDSTVEGSGTLVITVLTSDHIKGTMDNVDFISTDLLLPAVSLYDGSFDMKLERQ